MNYEAEPYILSADISGNPDCRGKAGWSWYTGSAGWFFRTVTENLLGISLKNGELAFEPKLPSFWSEVRVSLRDKNGKVQSFILSSSGAVLCEDKA